MSGDNPYLRYVSSLAQLAHDGKQFQLGGFPMPAHAGAGEHGQVTGSRNGVAHARQ